MPNRGLPEDIQPLDSGHISHHDTVNDLLNPVFDDWRVAGIQAGEEVDRPTDLDAENANFLWWNNDAQRMDLWSGTEWIAGRHLRLHLPPTQRRASEHLRCGEQADDQPRRNPRRGRPRHDPGRGGWVVHV